jgi:hypothetical protein
MTRDDVTFPIRRTPQASATDHSLIAVLEEMYRDNEKITARGVTERLEGINHASALVRDEWRAARIAEWQARQAELQKLLDRVDRNSPANIANAMAKKDERIRELEGQVQLLLASHRAMVLAVGETGGMPAWTKLFTGYEDALERLRRMGALPVAEVRKLRGDDNAEG